MRVVVDQAEYAKFCYIIKSMDAVDRAHAVAKSLADELRLQDGTRAEMEFDWLNIVRHVTPQLQVIFLRDSHRFEEDRQFVKYPCAVIVVRTAQVVELDRDFELTLEEPPTDNSGTDATNAIQVLRQVARSREGTRAMDAEKLIRQLERALLVK